MYRESLAHVFCFVQLMGERGIEIALFFCYNRVNYSLKRFIGGKSVFGKPKCPNKTGFCRKLNIKVREKHADHNRRIRRRQRPGRNYKKAAVWRQMSSMCRSF